MKRVRKPAPKGATGKTVGNERDREHFFVMYDNIDLIEKHCEELTAGCIHKYAVIYHPSDVYPADHEKAGELKPPHCHVYVRFYQPKSLNRARELMKISEQNVLSEFVLSTVKSLRYLLHLDDCDKYQYNQSSIRSNFDVTRYLGANRSTANSNLTQACIDMANGVPMIQLLSRYGDEFIKNVRNIQHIASIIREQDYYNDDNYLNFKDELTDTVNLTNDKDFNFETVVRKNIS